MEVNCKLSHPFFIRSSDDRVIIAAIESAGAEVITECLCKLFELKADELDNENEVTFSLNEIAEVRLPDHRIRPFLLRDDIYFIDKEAKKLCKRSLRSNAIYLFADNDGFFPPMRLTRFYQASVFAENSYWYFFDDAKKTGALWALKHLGLNQWECLKQFDRHAVDCPVVNVFPNGIAVIAGKCLEESCSDKGHIYQIDLLASRHWRRNDIPIGRGGFGYVLSGFDEDRGIPVAIKVPTEGGPSATRHSKRKMDFATMAEVVKLRSLDHPNIIRVYGFSAAHDGRVLFFMELMKESVRERYTAQPNNRLSEKEACKILQHALEGLVYLHTLKPKPIVHLDIKGDNILLDESGNVKLGDFGLNKDISLNSHGSTDQALKESVGTEYWKAPELLSLNPQFGRKADVWSIGCTLVEMMTGAPPYLKIRVSQLAHNHSSLSFDPKELVPEASKYVHDLLEKTFRRATKNSSGSETAEKIRPYSNEILAQVILMNELPQAEADIRAAEKSVLDAKKNKEKIKQRARDLLFLCQKPKQKT